MLTTSRSFLVWQHSIDMPKLSGEMIRFTLPPIYRLAFCGSNEIDHRRLPFILTYLHHFRNIQSDLFTKWRFQIEGTYRRQNKCDPKIEICFEKGRKHCGKRKKLLVTSIFSFSNIFKSCLSQGCQKSWSCGKTLKQTISRNQVPSYMHVPFSQEELQYLGIFRNKRIGQELRSKSHFFPEWLHWQGHYNSVHGILYYIHWQ